MSDLILPGHLRPVFQSYTEQHIRALSRLALLEDLTRTVRAMPRDHFDNPQHQPVLSTPLGVAIEVTGLLSAVLTLQSADAEIGMQEQPDNFHMDEGVAKAMPMLLWLTHGIHTTIKQGPGVPAPGTMVTVLLPQSRHRLETVCDAVRDVCLDVRAGFTVITDIPNPEHVQ